MPFLFAEATESPMSMIGAVTAAFLGSMSLLAWVLRHVLSKTLPEQQAAHREQLADERKSNQEQQSKERELAGQMYLGLLARLEALHETTRQGRDVSVSNQQSMARAQESQEKLVRMLIRLVRRSEAGPLPPAAPTKTPKASS